MIKLRIGSIDACSRCSPYFPSSQEHIEAIETQVGQVNIGPDVHCFSQARRQKDKIYFGLSHKERAQQVANDVDVPPFSFSKEPVGGMTGREGRSMEFDKAIYPSLGVMEGLLLSFKDRPLCKIKGLWIVACQVFDTR